jgi:hypothetical protein
MMEETVSKALDINSILTWLTTQEDFRTQNKIYKISISVWQLFSMEPDPKTF